MNTSYNRDSGIFNSSIVNEDTDDFIVGDRVWVDGLKPGYIQFIGETQFAPGEWAGVVFDSPIGKHDGMMKGVRYFQCQPNRGTFCRLHRLTRLPLSDDAECHLHKNYKYNRASSTTPDGTRHTTTTTRINKDTKTPSYMMPQRPSKIITTITTTTTSLDKKQSGGPLRLNERVTVNTNRGMQSGVVRYIGRTEFADGQWIGIELDEPYGKNNGSVSGKRYFTCPMKYGLFAPPYKVVRGTPLRTITRTRVDSGPKVHF